MAEDDNRRAVERLYSLIGKQDWTGAHDLFHQDYVQEWPQSGERIRGVDNSMAINQSYPDMPGVDVRRVLASGDVVMAEVTLKYPKAGSYHGVSIFEFRDGKIVKQTDYFAQPFEAPEWRSKWVEKM
ncbi:MAG: nuclear transport factor 2 family protein [Actinomycetota bacterium]|nr:nuclear transport factor 2 family protein [Actinomycetota bacterium]